jgi:phage terminase large subunit
MNPNYRNYVFQGSSRAGKSYNIVLWLVINILKQENKVYSIVRKTLPSLKGSILRDLKEILIKLELYDSNKWHSVDGYVEIGSNIIEWFSLDSEERIRGRKRDICFVNEATELSYEEFVQLSLRTSERMILDFNPSLWQSW